ncbi:MAG: putative ABC transporter permease [Clostridia bacterium]|nr:putative ABC transporter permease [Clostridia bacterium]
MELLERFFLNLYLYAFLSWVVETAVFALGDGRFVNRGFLNLPVNLSCGIAAAILMEALPTLEHHGLLQFVLCCVVYSAVRRFSDQFVSNRKQEIVAHKRHRHSAAHALFDTLIAGAILITYLVVHPVLMGVLLLVPGWVKHIAVLACLLLTIADYVCVRYVLHTGGAARRHRETQKLGRRIAEGIWRRLERAYPGVSDSEHEQSGRLVFAHGICRDKLVWVCLISAFLGALIEMVYCRVTGGVWMNRSSVLYGSFSLVWGFGAVVLTVMLQRLADKNDRWVFLAGFVIGGAYEYLCSVFTEIVFGTVFWDYSHMKWNIGGRTNVVYCIFWGLLAVVWIKVLYPPMDRFIERIPPLGGKVVTWIVVFVMVCNSLLTAAAMIRYADRQENPQPENAAEAFLDARYGDAWMQERWPNMVFAQDGSEAGMALSETMEDSYEK